MGYIQDLMKAAEEVYTNYHQKDMSFLKWEALPDIQRSRWVDAVRSVVGRMHIGDWLLENLPDPPRSFDDNEEWKLFCMLEAANELLEKSQVEPEAWEQFRRGIFMAKTALMAGRGLQEISRYLDITQNMIVDPNPDAELLTKELVHDTSEEDGVESKPKKSRSKKAEESNEE